MPIRLSRYLGVDPGALRRFGVLNAHIGIDNRLFVDPNLLPKARIPEFVDSRRDLEKYFSAVIALLTKSKRIGDIAWNEAVRRLAIPEEHGAALGYSSAGGHGRAIGIDMATSLAARAKEIIDLGIDDPEIFELIGLFHEKFGPDLLSDMAVGILKDRFLSYTERITRELDLRPQRGFVLRGKTWTLPVHPDNRRALILVPSVLLNQLPVALDHSEIGQVAAFNSEVRRVWNDIVAKARRAKRAVSKGEIRQVLLEDPRNLKDLIEVYRRAAASGYDFDEDPEGLFSWEYIGKAAAEASPIALAIKQPQTLPELQEVLGAIIKQFKKNIEENKLYTFLYKDDGKPRHEVFAQRLFYAIADAYCEANNVDLSREPDAGNGPVDFKLSRGYHGRILVEVKKSTNPDLLHGFETQLRAYENAEATSESVYLILQMADAESSINDVISMQRLQERARKRVPQVIVIDARKKLSASKRGRRRRRR